MEKDMTGGERINLLEPHIKIVQFIKEVSYLHGNIAIIYEYYRLKLPLEMVVDTIG
jgi:hypothetical protein